MPLYEYQCRACGKVTDVRHGYNETHADPCPACGGELARRFSPAGIVFKGSGFYVTDSRKAAEAKASAAKSGETKKSAETKKDDSKSEPAAADTSAAGTQKAEPKSDTAAA